MQKILIVDDDPQFRSLVVPLLVKRGYAALEAGDGRAATRLVQSECPNLIVVDGLLPDTDGIAWIKRLRNLGNQTPVVFASAFWRDKKTFDQLTRELGVTLVVRKPVIAQVFADQLDAELSKARKPPVPVEPESEKAFELDVESEFVQLRQSYGRTLPAKASELSKAIEKVRAGVPGAQEEARVLAHRLRGTAGSYGFPVAGEAAGRIEDAVSDVSQPPAGDDWKTIGNALLELTAATEAAAEQLRPPEPGAVPARDRILVFDDDPEFLSHVSDLARRHVTEISAATTPAAALEIARTQKPGAAILDVNIHPDGTSYALAGDLRALPGCEGMPIAFISANASPVTRIAAAHAGGSLFLSKPLEGTDFADAVQQLLAQRPTQPRALIVGDDAEFHAWAAGLLAREGMFVEGSSGAEDILERMDRLRPDVLLLDTQLDKISGFDACRMIRMTPAWRDLPVLFLTRSASADTRIAAFQAGGDDYLVKPVVPEELLARVRVRLDRARLMRERADLDTLTGIQLRRSFMARFSALLADADRRESPVSLCLIDIDSFKRINDQHGHLSGDRVLARFGKLLGTRFRATDLRSRWGGEEFMLGFPGENAETTCAIAERLLEEVRQMSFESDDAGRFTITFSAGVSSYPADGANIQDLVRTADRRLYLAKNGGRDRVVAVG